VESHRSRGFPVVRRGGETGGVATQVATRGSPAPSYAFALELRLAELIGRRGLTQKEQIA